MPCSLPFFILFLLEKYQINSRILSYVLMYLNEISISSLDCHLIYNFHSLSHQIWLYLSEQWGEKMSIWNN